MASRSAPVSRFLAVTEAWATGAPEESLTTPCRLAAICAGAIGTVHSRAASAQIERLANFFIRASNSIRFVSRCQTDSIRITIRQIYADSVGIQSLRERVLLDGCSHCAGFDP